MQYTPIEEALSELRQGRMIIIADDENREREGDLVMAAEAVTPEAINFMMKEARGLICLTLTEATVDRLRIPLMPVRNAYPNQAAFATSIEAATGVTTGVSAFDRARTIQVAVHPDAKPEDISMPGHVFPLRAREGGVFVRAGHTEASVDMMRLAGLTPAGVICEVVKDDGSMARFPDLQQFAEKHHVKIVSVNDLIAYRLQHEVVIEETAAADLPLECGDEFTIKIFRDRYELTEHIALIHKAFDKNNPAWVRIHSECMTGDMLGSLLCDCGGQLKMGLNRIGGEKGVLLYMRQEGRGIGLSNKIKAYSLQQLQGLDTVEANHRLGFLADHRRYGICAQILRHLEVKQIRLLTNNPHKIADIERFGIEVVERIPIETPPKQHNQHYLKTKKGKLGHLLNL